MKTEGTPVTGLGQIFRIFLKIGLLSFGGPAAQIALMHRVLVEENKWLTERQYLDSLSFCMLLPGPEAMQLATFAGWRMQGMPGGLIAGLLFVLPGAMVIFMLASLYVLFGEIPLVDGLFLGVQAAAVVIVIQALLRVSGRALQSTLHWLVSGLAFIAISFLAVPFPIIVLSAGLFGALVAKSTIVAAPAPSPVGHIRRTALTIVLGLCAWFLPVALITACFGEPILLSIGIFFSKLAIVTFGGAYAVLAYMAQDVVAKLGWLSATEMMDGLGLAETTPGPLILVTQFVGFLAGFREGGFGLAVAAALVTLWVTFAPCFVWIFAGAPYIERMASQPRLSAALNAITAAVVGVILNLSLWFALHVVFGAVSETHVGPLKFWLPDLASINPVAVILIALSGYLLLQRQMGIGWVLTLSATAAWFIDALSP